MSGFPQTIVASLALLAAAMSAHAAEPVFPSGSRIGLTPPPGMVASTAFQGFEDPFNQAKIVFVELAARSFADMAKEFSAETMKAGGMVEDVREDLRLGEARGFIVAARQTEGGVLMRKWALVAAVQDITAIIVVAVPQGAGDTYPDAAIRAALATFAVRAKLPVEQQLALLPYRLGDLAGFRLVRASRDGIALLTFGPSDAATAEEQPFLLIATPAGEMPQAADREAFARRILANSWEFKDVRYISSASLRIGAQQGHEIIAETTSTKTNTELTLVQWLRSGTSGYVQMLGVSRRELWPSILPRLRTVRDGIEPK